MQDPLVTTGVVRVARPVPRLVRLVLEWNPLEWTVTERCLLVAALMLPFSAGYWGIDEAFLRWPRLAPYYDFGVLAGFQGVLAAFTAAWIAVVVAGVGLRRRARGRSGGAAETALLWVTIELYSVGNAVGAVFAGPVTTPHGIVLVGGVAVGFFLFEPRVVVWGMFSAFLVLTLDAIAILAGWTRYAPLLASAPYVHGHVSGWWLLSMTIVASCAALALVTLLVYLTLRLRDRERRLFEIARTDALTGVSNRRRFVEVLSAEVDRARRYRTDLSCVLLDLDHFKRINDRFGHTTGDRVLVAAAEAFRAGLRGVDAIARWGGEEFVLLLPQTDRDGACAVAERCRATLEELVFAAPDHGESVPLTVSVGVATFRHEPGETGESLLRRADEAMYRAKSSGRNRVVG